jgi:hypothetical protein
LVAGTSKEPGNRKMHVESRVMAGNVALRRGRPTALGSRRNLNTVSEESWVTSLHI